MIETIDSVVRQPGAKEKISVVIGLEEGTPEKEEVETIRIHFIIPFSEGQNPPPTV